ncbi:MAG: hypothetical protein ACP5MX_02180 [Candidatus Micrarchaeia archaeon]
MVTKYNTRDLSKIFDDIVEQRVEGMVVSGKVSAIRDIKVDTDSIKNGYMVVDMNGDHFLFLLGMTNNNEIKITKILEPDITGKYSVPARPSYNLRAAKEEVERIIQDTPQRERKAIVGQWIDAALEEKVKRSSSSVEQSNIQ